MKWKKVISVMLAAACVAGLAACGSSDSSSEGGDSTEEKDTLVMATNAEFPPYEYYEGQDIVGIDVDIANAIADELGMELKIDRVGGDKLLLICACIYPKLPQRFCVRFFFF